MANAVRVVYKWYYGFDKYQERGRKSEIMSKSTMKFNVDNYVSVLADQVSREFAFKAGTPEELKCWQSDFRPRLREALGIGNIESNGRCPLKPKQIGEEVFDAYVRQEWIIHSEHGFELPFFVLIPKDQPKPCPLVLAPHGHSKSGKDGYVGIWHSESERADIVDGQRDIALQAVEAGYVAIAPDMRGLASLRRKQDLEEDNAKSCPRLQMQALMFDRTLIGERVWDIGRLIDYKVVPIVWTETPSS